MTSQPTEPGEVEPQPDPLFTLHDLDAIVCQEGGRPIPFDDVLVGDTIRSRTVRGTGVVEHKAGTVHHTQGRYLTGPDGMTIAVRAWDPDVYLIHRPTTTEVQ